MVRKRALRIALLITCLVVGLRGSAVAAPSSSGTDTNWPQYRFGPDHKGVNPFETTLNTSNVSGLHELWATPMGGIFGLASPTVVNGILYIGNFDHKVYAVDAATGAILWSRTTGDLVEATPAVSGGVVFALSLDGVLHTYDAVTGIPGWSVQTTALISPPMVAAGRVFVAGTSIEAYDARTGLSLWSTPINGTIVSGVTVQRGRLFAAGSTYVYSLDATTGTVEWTKRLDTFQVSTPAVAGGLLYLGDFDDGWVYALRAGTGSVAWKTFVGGTPDNSPAVSEGVVYIGEYSSDRVLALDAVTGQPKWSVAGGGSQGSVTVANGVAYAASLFGEEILAIDAATGTTLWSEPLASTQSSPTVVNGVVYVGADDQKLHAFGL